MYVRDDLLRTYRAVCVMGSRATPRTLHVAAVARAASEASAVTLRRTDRLRDYRQRGVSYRASALATVKRGISYSLGD